MRSCRRLQASLLSILIAGLAANRMRSSDSAPPIGAIQKAAAVSSGLPFEVGEKFSYLVSWKVFDAGIATMTLADRSIFQGQEAYKVLVTVQSAGIVSTLFRVDDLFESFFQSRELCSRQFTKNIQEGPRHRRTILQFDLKPLQVRMEDRDLNRPELPPKRTSSPIPGCVQDVLSALYVVRTKNLKLGDSLHFMINDGGRTYNVEVEVQAQEEVRTPLGVFQTFRLEPKVFDGLFKTKGRLFVWLTNDAARMPVQLKAKVNIGTITVALTQVNHGNLRPAGIPAKPSFE
jgi:hypothetical protein